MYKYFQIGEVGQKIKEEEIKRAAEKEKVAKLEKEKEKEITEVKPDPPKPITKVPKVEKVESIEEIKFCKPTSSLDLGSGLSFF